MASHMVLEIRARWHQCAESGHVWRQDATAAAETASESVVGGGARAPGRVGRRVPDVARIAVAWRTAPCWPRAAGPDRRSCPVRGGVAVIGVDEHVWRHTRRGEKYVTVGMVIDLAPIRDGVGHARLLDMVEGHS